jgi:hypothetical protein
MTKTFDHLFVLGKPASGKSEFLDFMKNISDAERAERFHIGRLNILDDFVWLWEKFEEDDIWEKIKGKRLHSKRAGHGYILDDAALFDFLMAKMSDTVVKKYLPEEKFYREGTLLIEFSRGGEKPYLPALEYFDAKVLERSAIFYVEVTAEESRRRNEARYVEKLKSSILAHKTPDEDMRRFYSNDDWRRITNDKRDGHLKVGNVKVPFVTMGNEPESKDPAVLGPRYSTALNRLWTLQEG